DLNFMDVQMPGMDGPKTTEAIRAWETEQGRDQTPIVALTAHALASERRALLQGGMDDYLTKPINEHQLSQVVLKWTGLSLRAAQAARLLEPTSEQGGGLPVLDHEEGLRLAGPQTCWPGGSASWTPAVRPSSAPRHVGTARR